MEKDKATDMVSPSQNGVHSRLISPLLQAGAIYRQHNIRHAVQPNFTDHARRPVGCK